MQNYRAKSDQGLEVEGKTTKETRGNFRGDENILYLDCGGVS